MRLLLATTNRNKVREILPVLVDALRDAAAIEIVTLADVPPMDEPEETGGTFWANARIKALAYARRSGLTTVAEDSGLEIDALGGEPGVRSARFLGPDVGYEQRFAEIFRRLEELPQASRRARFVTALAVAEGDRIIFETEARIEGLLAPAAAGSLGFGYDPIFFYPPFARTTAEMTLDEKTAVSHRARAFRDLRRAVFTTR